MYEESYFDDLPHPDALDITDADTLLSIPLPSTKYYIRGLLPTGIHLLCGAPKVGKSWLSLWLAVQLSRGEPVWDLPTEACGVLYLCLEDTLNRVKERLYRIAEDVPNTLHLCTGCHQIGLGLEQQLERYLYTYPATKVIIIDTLQKVRKEQSEGSVYRTDYKDISALKRFADSHGITILLVHHLRKMQDETDPFNMVSGSNGLTGAVDSTFLLYKDKRTEQNARFIVTGRDIEMQEFRLRFENCIWKLVEHKSGEPQEEEPIPQELHAVVQFVRDRKVWGGTATELCELLKAYGVTVAPSRITRMLGRFSEQILKAEQIGYALSRSARGRSLSLFDNAQMTA